MAKFTAYLLSFVAVAASGDLLANVKDFVRDNGFKFVTVVDVAEVRSIRLSLVKELGASSYVRSMDLKDVW